MTVAIIIIVIFYMEWRCNITDPLIKGTWDLLTNGIRSARLLVKIHSIIAKYTEKSVFWPDFRRLSTQNLIEIYNNDL